ncbi:protein DBF4 homolog A [Discoglossus pictus]
MGPKRIKGVTQGRGVKIKPAEKNPPAKRAAATCKPFTGKVFYLDLTAKLLTERLEKDIKDLGGAVESFLSKEISYLITNKKEAKCAKTLKLMCSSPRPDSSQSTGNGLAHPNGKTVRHEGLSRKKAEKGLSSRGKSLVNKAIQEQEILPKNSILYNAWNWGVKILHVEEAKMYIEQKKRDLQQGKKDQSSDKAASKRPTARRKAKPQPLMIPYIKVEDSSCQYRPLYLVLPFFRSFKQYIPEQCDRVRINKKLKAGLMATKAIQSMNPTFNLLYGRDPPQAPQPANAPPVKGLKKRGYCECCLKKYEDLETHLLSQPHKTYAEGNNYQEVDNIISQFDFDFVDWSKYRHSIQSLNISSLPVENRLEQDEHPPEKIVSQQNNSSQKLQNAPLEGTSAPLLTGVLYETVHYPDLPHSTSHPPLSPLSLTKITLAKQSCALDSISTKPLTHAANPPPSTFSPDIGDYTEKQATVYTESNPQGLNASNIFGSIKNDISERTKVLHSPVVFETLNSSFAAIKSLTQTVNELQPKEMSEQNGNSEKTHSCEQPDAASAHDFPSSASGTLHRKVKTVPRKTRNLYTCSTVETYKVSVAQDNDSMSSPKDCLMDLFQSSKNNSEFLGFPACNPCSMEEDYQEPSQGNMLWSLFTDTHSSASSFAGF